jgi:peptide deformylase
MSRSVKHLVQDLKDTLAHDSDGVGLAAPQLGAHRRVVVVQLGGRREDKGAPGPPVALINPKILATGNEQRDFDGCLSFPGLYGETVRPHYLRVTGLNERGRPFDRVFEGFDAVVVHHEIDHLDGVLFVDRAQSIEDLYRVRVDKNGELVRVPVQAIYP